MEALGKKNAESKARKLALKGIADAVLLGAVLAGAQAFTNPVGSGSAQVKAFDTPNQFIGGGQLARTYIIMATISTNAASTVDLTGSVQLRQDAAPLAVVPQSPIGIAVGGHTDSDLTAVTLFWIVSFPATGGFTSVHSFGIQSDIGGGNTHQLPAGAAEVLVLQVA